MHYREKFSHVFHQKSDAFILLHLSTASGPQKSNGMLFPRKSIPNLWIAVQNIWKYGEKSQVFCMVIHRHNDEGKTAIWWQKQHKSGTMDSLSHTIKQGDIPKNVTLFYDMKLISILFFLFQLMPC